MSRCFPFPPPGYEKKARNDQAEILEKDKRKEKKHKKEKRDKERKEGKDRKDKDRNKDKHRNKKDRKERHKDKKRDKDRGKDESKASDDRRTTGQLEGFSEEKLGFGIHNAEEAKDQRFTEELGRRIRDEECAANRFPGSIPKILEGLDTATGMQKERSNGNGMVAKLTSKDQRGIEGNKMVANIFIKDQRKTDGLERLVEKDEVKKINEKEVRVMEFGGGKGDRKRDRDREEKRNKEKDKDRPKDKEKQKEKERVRSEQKHKELDETKDTSKKDHVYSLNSKTVAPDNDNENCAGTDGYNKKRKGFEMNGFLHENDVRPSKLPTPVSSSHPAGENGRTLELCHVPSPRPPSRHGNINNIKEMRKVRDNKEHVLNGTAETQPSAADIKPLVAAGISVKAEASIKPASIDVKAEGSTKTAGISVKGETSMKPAGITVMGKTSTKPAGVSVKVEATRKPAGTSVEGEASMKPASTSVKGEASIKPPHPDSKYLSQVYSVPKMEEWPESHNQEWLFSNSNSQPKPTAKFETEALQVWSEGLQIEEADVFALPYVIPF